MVIALFMMGNVLFLVYWVVVNWNSDNMWLNNDWIWDFHWVMDWIRDLDFLDDWNFNFLINWILFNMMMVNSVNMIWNFNLNGFTAN